MGKERKNHAAKKGDSLGTDSDAAQEEIRVLAYQLFASAAMNMGMMWPTG